MTLSGPRPRLLWLALLALSASLAACSSDDPDPVDAAVDAEVPGDDADGETGLRVDAGLDARTILLDATLGTDSEHRLPDGAVCKALGCDELGYECGETVDNCGDPLNCNLAGNATPCLAPTRCGGDPDRGQFKCGCQPRPNACEAQGAQCGFIDECGNRVDCGNCADGSLCLTNSCACTALPNPCGDRVCGMASDGCGKMIACGANQGACPTGACSATGMCTCRPKSEACVGQTGAFSENGCSYDCSGGLCIPDNLTACAGAECGSALNNCGETVQCGLLAGACAAGSRCVGPQFVLDGTLPAQSATYQGGYCAPEGVAKMLGKYAVRVHAFRQAGNTSVNFINRAEAVSLVLVQYARARNVAQLTDNGCVATTIGDPAEFAGGGTRSVLPKYRNLGPAIMDLSISGATFARGDVPNPIIGFGQPAGFTLGMPAFCVGLEGQTVDLPVDDPRRGKWWADNKCTCPTNPNTLPARPASADPNNYSTVALKDCRINDDDKDGKPGFTAKASALGIINSELYNANISHGTWTGSIRDDRYHVGWAGDTVMPVERVVLGCLATGGACDKPGVDCGCAERWSAVQFVPLADSAALDCSVYYSNVGTPNEAVNQAAIDQQFSVPFGTCSGPGQCPANSLCRANRCFPQTSKGACTSGSQNPCPAGTFCEACPNDPGSAETETTCRSDTACWPTPAECPSAGSPAGGYCTATPP
ncbi:MAG: hypothetical protein ABW352_06775 [Polyangiales bacterium]